MVTLRSWAPCELDRRPASRCPRKAVPRGNTVFEAPVCEQPAALFGRPDAVRTLAMVFGWTVQDETFLTSSRAAAKCLLFSEGNRIRES